VVSDIKRSATKVEAEAVDDDEDVPPVEVSENADGLPQQSAVASSGLFNDFENATADLKQPFDSVAPKEVSDNDYEPLIVFEDQQDVGEEEELHGGVVLDGESSDGAASQSSDSELFDLRTTRALREHYSATESSSGLSDDEHFPVVSVLTDSEQHTNEQDSPLETPEQERNFPDDDAFPKSGSDSDVHTTSEPEEPGDTDGLVKVRDDEQHAVVSASKDVDHHIFEEQELREAVMQESDPSDDHASQTSGSDFDTYTAPAPKQYDVSEHLKPISHDKGHTFASASKDVDQHTDIHDTGLSDAGVFDTSDSDVSDMQLPPATILGPFLSPTGREHTVENRPIVSPEIVLRGLIRDAHPQMVHFTLPHSLFSPDDLRKGLQYAYSMLQAATSELTILELIADEATEMTESDLRRWIELVDDAFPLPCSEPRITAIFESLSIGEMKAALEELVHSRLAVESETEKTRMSLQSKMVANERQEKGMVIPAKRAAKFDAEGDSSSKKRRASEED
jgi:hypothetical protein